MATGTSPIRNRYSVPGEPPCELLVGDCREIMPLYPPGSFDLIFADPPFNFGEPYSEWKDTLPGHEYRQFTREWLDAAVPLLSESGCLWVNCPDEIAARILIHLEDEHSLILRNWCVWHYRFGQCRHTAFIRSKVHTLYFVRDVEACIWNPNEVLVTSDRVTYGDKRTLEKASNPGQRVPLDVWGVTEAFDPDYPGDGPYWGRVQGNNAERRKGYPNQLPEKYLERVIRSTSLPGGRVLSPFAGSGTDLVVARALGRISVGIEIGEREAAGAVTRVEGGSVRVK